MSIELDHIFWMVPKDDVDRVAAAMSALGLKESYRRQHPGQGTSNICYCFENAFLEILWLEDEADARSPAIARTKLADRALGQANPFGIAWRGDANVSMWDFKPPYLPKGVVIPMAVASDDHDLPLLFSFPGSKPPSEMPPDRHGGMQKEAGFERLEIAKFRCADMSIINSFSKKMVPAFQVELGAPSMTLSLAGLLKQITLDLPF
ncbi:MAG: VOC family protein [Pseudomonadota bacterium]